MLLHNYRIDSSYINCHQIEKLNKMAIACAKLKITLPNNVIRGGSGTPAISKMEFFVALALHKPLTFAADISILGRS